MLDSSRLGRCTWGGHRLSWHRPLTRGCRRPESPEAVLCGQASAGDPVLWPPRAVYLRREVLDRQAQQGPHRSVRATGIRQKSHPAWQWPPHDGVLELCPRPFGSAHRGDCPGGVPTFNQTARPAQFGLQAIPWWTRGHQTLVLREPAHAS